jgi:hypothetical protein
LLTLSEGLAQENCGSGNKCILQGVWSAEVSRLYGVQGIVSPVASGYLIKLIFERYWVLFCLKYHFMKI